MTQQPNWYRARDLLPPYNVEVFLQFEGREIKAARGVDKRTGNEVWKEVFRGRQERLIVLRPAIVAAMIWRPQNEATWRLPLPEPVAAPTGSFTSIRQSMSAADAAAIAEEMDDERAAIAAAKDGCGDPFGRWWRGVGLHVRYEAAGAVTDKWCEARVLRALAHCEYRRRTGVPAISGVEAAIAEAEEAALRSMAEYESLHSSDVAPWLRPTPADADDFTVAMNWFTRLNESPRVPYRLNWPQMVLEARARDEMLKWTQVGIRLISKRDQERGVEPPSPNVCKRIYEKAIGACVRFANDVAYVDPRLSALKERNRQARRRA